MRLALSALLLAACASDETVEDTATFEADADTDADSDADTDADTDADGPSYLTTVYTPYLEESCGGCHLENGYIHPPITSDPSSLVGAEAFSGLIYVTPGDPASSLLWLKVNDEQPRGNGERMPPPDDAEALSADALAAIEAWIEGGANP